MFSNTTITVTSMNTNNFTTTFSVNTAVYNSPNHRFSAFSKYFLTNFDDKIGKHYYFSLGKVGQHEQNLGHFPGMPAPFLHLLLTVIEVTCFFMMFLPDTAPEHLQHIRKRKKIKQLPDIYLVGGSQSQKMLSEVIRVSDPCG